MIADGKAYKEAKALTTLNVNKIATRLVDGEPYLGGLSGKIPEKYSLNIIKTGQYDMDNNEILHLKLTSKDGKRIVYLKPLLEFYPLGYYGLEYKSGKCTSRIEYSAYDTKNISFIGSQGSPWQHFGKSAMDVAVSEGVKEKIINDNKELIEKEKTAQVKAYMKFLDDYVKDEAHTNYSKSLNEIGDKVILLLTLGTTDETHLKVEKKMDANGNIEEIIFTIPFTDGSYPDKEEFKIHATKNKLGLLEIVDGKNTIGKGTLIPFWGQLLVCTISGESSNSKELYCHIGYPMVMDVMDHDKVKALESWSTSTPYQEYWKMATVSMEYDHDDKYELSTFFGRVLLPKLIEHAKK